jgi:ribose transport system permease protein
MKYFETLKGAANFIEALKRYGIFLVLLVLILFFSATSDHFLVSTNLLNVARQVSMLGIAAVGFAFVLLLGGIDLSLGSNVTLVNIVGAWLMVNAEMNFVLAIILVLVMATAIGFVNGWIIANVQMPR